MKKLTLLFLILANTVLLKAQFGPPQHINENFYGSYFKSHGHDFDGDDDTDILIESSNQMVWYENKGDGILGDRHEVIGTGILRGMDVADLDLDEDLDILYFNSGYDAILWHENDGKGDFGKARPAYELNIDNASRFSSMSKADFDKDGDLDILACYGHTPNYVLVWLENKNGNFSDWQMLISTPDFDRLESVDMDNDGDIDAVAFRYETLHWYENLDKGEFLKDGIVIEHIIPLTSKTHYTEFSDMDADGDFDIVLGGDYGIQWCENLGEGSFADPKFISDDTKEWVNFLEVVDLDGDEDNDLVVHGFSQYIIENQENGQFKKVGIQGVPSFIGDDHSKYYASRGTTLSDLNGDGKVDFLTFSENEIEWFENKGVGLFKKKQEVEKIYKTSLYAPNGALLDIDNDGLKDVVTGLRSKEIFWYRNLKNGEYGTPNYVDSLGLILWVGGLDVDGDGITDLLVHTKDESFVSYKNNGDGTLGKKKALSERDAAQVGGDFTMVDFDHDKDLDFLWFHNYGRLYWAENKGDWTFEEPTYIAGSRSFRGYELVDLDSDGWLDVLSESSASILNWYRNDGNGTFAAIPIYGNTTERRDFLLSTDIDGDGLRDIIYTIYDGFKKKGFVMYNEGYGDFGVPKEIKEYDGFDDNLNFLYLHSAADIDGDGDKDFIVAMPDNRGIYWMENFGSDGFSDRRLITDQYDPHTLRMEDMDGDGDDDLFIINHMEMPISWHENFFLSSFKLKGKVYYDANQNGVFDKEERPLKLVKTQVTPSALAGYTDELGEYTHAVDSGRHTVTPYATSAWELTSDSVSYTAYLSSTKRIFDNLDFGFYPKPTKTNISTHFVGQRARCQREVQYWVGVRNEGTTLPSGVIEVQLDDSLGFVGSSIKQDSIVGQKVYWHFDELFFADQVKLKLIVKIPAINSVDNELSSMLKVYEVDENGKVIGTVKKELIQEVRCAYDPNDKNVSPKGLGALGLVEPKQELTYLVRFQNTGNDTAFAVLIRDQLDANLDWSTLKPLSSSHPMEVNIERDGEVVFRFSDILLPDSNVNEPESHGYVEYSVMPKLDVKPLATISSPAAIYFDFNPAVVTNKVLNTILCFTAPNPKVTLNFPYLETDIKGDFRYQWYRNDTLLKGDTLETIVPTLDGAYIIEVIDSNTCNGLSAPFDYKAVGISETKELQAAVYPNPFTESTTFLFSGDLEGNFNLVVYNVVGAEVLRYDHVQGNQLTISKQELGVGLFLPYLVNIQTGEKTPIEKIVAH